MSIYKYVSKRKFETPTQVAMLAFLWHLIPSTLPRESCCGSPLIQLRCRWNEKHGVPFRPFYPDPHRRRHTNEAQKQKNNTTYAQFRPMQMKSFRSWFDPGCRLWENRCQLECASFSARSLLTAPRVTACRRAISRMLSPLANFFQLLWSQRRAPLGKWLFGTPAKATVPLFGQTRCRVEQALGKC